jgi:DNA helicase II / ATP-dependent DNA helicase PcrA
MLDIDTLNPEQRSAVVTTEGPLLVLAGAGSGKTRVLTYRLAFILDSGLAGPHNILAMTFTNKAAGEMKERIESLMSKTSVNYDLNWIGTFHSICVKLLKRHSELVGLGKNFTIYDSSDQQVAIKEAMKRLDISIKEFNPNAIHSYISSAKNELVDPEAYQMYAQGYFQQIVARVYPEYQKVLKENNAVDFDDLLLYVVKLFTQYPDVLEKYQEQFRYILVDEYQDTNHAQYIIVNKLAQKHRNICCVGDDDQSIYSFRGATIKNILNFEKDYPESKIIKLEQNYRSSKKILEASYQVISKNKNRKDKKLWTDNTDGENIVIYTATDEVAEATWIVTKILEIGKTTDYDQIAILYRTNAQSRSLEEALIQSGIPYKIIGGLRFYDRKEVKDIIAYLRCIYNSKDNSSLERIINVPKRGIGAKTVQGILENARTNGQSGIEYLVSGFASESAGVQKFGQLLQEMTLKSSSLTVSELINYILEKTEYIKMLEDGTLENESRIENLKELISVATKHDNQSPEEGLESFIEEVSLLESVTDRSASQKSITLMTIHAAKGLEFKHVFVVGMEENLFPHSNSLMDEKEMEEERRLAYVAITRAKEHLYLTHTAKRKYFGTTQVNPLSRFVADIDPDLTHKIVDLTPFGNATSEFYEVEEDNSWIENIDLKVGDKVRHEYFGKGVIKSIYGTNVEIDFGSIYGLKELMLEYAKLEKV